MRETFTSGTVGRAPGNRCFYPEMPIMQNKKAGPLLTLPEVK
jgi:hypothetical protein